MRSYEILYDKLFRMNKWCSMKGNFSKPLQTQWIGFDRVLHDRELQTHWIGYDRVLHDREFFKILADSLDRIWQLCSMLMKFSAIYCYLKSFLISGIDSIKYCTMLAWSPGSMTNDRRTSWITIGPDFLVVNTHTAFWDCFIWR